ncbi:MAG TPA: hypothetical protein VLS94_08855 [Fusibacter sp.]|nr:hypothetical protein [Fusibacter sp.]
MNKHRAFWSAMGIEPSQEKSVVQTDFENFEKQIKIMVGKYGATRTVSLVRNVIVELQKEDE